MGPPGAHMDDDALMQQAILASLQEAEAPPPPTHEEISAMPVRELKERLQQRGISYEGVIEKDELVHLLHSAYQ